MAFRDILQLFWLACNIVLTCSTNAIFVLPPSTFDSQDDAKQTYVDLVEDLVSKEGGAASVQPSGTAASSAEGAYENLKVTIEGGVCSIMLNRPNKKNALTFKVRSTCSHAWVKSLYRRVTNYFRIGELEDVYGESVAQFTHNLARSNYSRLCRVYYRVLTQHLAVFFSS